MLKPKEHTLRLMTDVDKEELRVDVAMVDKWWERPTKELFMYVWDVQHIQRMAVGGCWQAKLIIDEMKSGSWCHLPLCSETINCKIWNDKPSRDSGSIRICDPFENAVIRLVWLVWLSVYSINPFSKTSRTIHANLSITAWNNQYSKASLRA